MFENRSRAASAVVFGLLVVVAVVGRWGQPDWCVTPLAAVTLFAARWFDRAAIAVLVPIVALGVSDLALASYDRPAVFLAVYAAMAGAVVWGRLLRRPAATPIAGAARFVCCAAAPAIGFFVLTNFAVWASQEMYAKTPAGLAECYTNALPFLRRMLAGDLVYTTALFGLAHSAGVFTTRPATRATEAV